MVNLIIGALVGTACTGLVAGIIAEYERRRAYHPEPPRVTPEDIKPLTDAIASLARTLRVTHSRGADEAAALGLHVLNLERKARGFPPLAGPRLTDADVGPLLRRAAPTYRGQP